MAIKLQHVIKLPLPQHVVGWEHQKCLSCKRVGSYTGNNKCWKCGGDLEVWVYHRLSKAASL